MFKKIIWFGGCLGSVNDEERSEMWYVVWIADQSESSKFWTQIAQLYKDLSLQIAFEKE